MKRFYFFYDSGRSAGLGHTMRCKKLAYILGELTQAQMFFVPNLQSLPKKDSQIDGIIVDSYVLQSGHYEALLTLCPYMLCFDDTNRIAYPFQSFVLNPALGAQELYVDNKQSATLLLGLSYAATSKDFLPNLECRQDIQDVLLSFGGADMLNFSHLLSQILAAHFPKVRLHLVLGKYFQGEVFKSQNLKIYRNLDSRDFGKLMRQCDIALSCGGGTLLELASSCLPTIVLSCASNQNFQIAQFKKLGAFMHAQDITEIVPLIESFDFVKRKESKQILSCLKIGDRLEGALKEIFL
ncbi:MAG: hypothetical protein MSA68_02400 [Helicobacter sp.]|nr:hypothetical protein [Helicobacter sp.]